ncbi:hypothetical protein GCM10010464_74180 [Pseudonocardia yunnanensis]
MVAGEARGTGHVVEVEWLGVMAVDQVARSPQVEHRWHNRTIHLRIVPYFRRRPLCDTERKPAGGMPGAQELIRVHPRAAAVRSNDA